MSTTTLPRIRDAQKKAEDSRYYMLRANRQMTTLALNRIRDQLENQRVDFNARLKHQSLELKMELLKRAEEEKAILKADEEMLLEVNIKIAKRRKKRADELQQQQDRKKEIKRRVDAKRKDKRFERKVIPEDEELKEEPKAETSGGGYSASLFPALTAKRLPDDLDIYMPTMIQTERREPKIKLNPDLIFPNARKPKLYRQLMTQSFMRETSRVNEKSLRKLREKYRVMAAAEEAKQQSLMDNSSTPYISSISNIMYQVPEDSRHSHLNRLLRQVTETRDALRLKAPRLPMSDRLKQTLEECVRQKKKGRKKGGKAKERNWKSEQSEATSAIPIQSAEPQPAQSDDPSSTQNGLADVHAEQKEGSETSSEVEEPTSAIISVPDSEIVSTDTKPLPEESSDSDQKEDPIIATDKQNSEINGASELKEDSNNDNEIEEKVWRLPSTSSNPIVPRQDDSVVKRVTLKGPVLTPIQSTEVSPQPTRESTTVYQHQDKETIGFLSIV